MLAQKALQSRGEQTPAKSWRFYVQKAGLQKVIHP